MSAPATKTSGDRPRESRGDGAGAPVAVGRVAPPPVRTRLPGVDGLRALAATAVLVQHVWRFADPDVSSPDWGIASSALHHLRIGLTLFFVISGFLLYRPFVAALHDGRSRPSFRSYFESRALRIIPAYWVILLATALVLQSAVVRVSVVDEVSTRLDDPANLLAAALLLQNYVPEWLLSGIGPAWSLNVEVVFYLLLPLLVLLGATLSSRASTPRGRWLGLLAPAAVLIPVSVVGKILAGAVEPVGPAPGSEGDWYSVIQRSFLYHADLFTAGMALAIAWVAVERRPDLLPARWRLAALFAIPLLLLGALRIAPLYGELSAIACALLVALVVLPGASPERPSLLTRFFDSRVMATIGLASYSIFLWHGPLIEFLREHGLTASGRSGFFFNLALVLAVTGVLSLLTYRYVERPALRLKARRRDRGPSRLRAADRRLETDQEHAAP
jgi:peptidoglycan/LPS O-acetylase OafA/YrhL